MWYTAAMPERTFRFVARTGAKDANGQITDMDGWDLARFRANPVIFLNHRTNDPPVGKATDLIIAGDRMLATIQFAPTEMGQQLELLTDRGFLRGASVQFHPTSFDLVPEKGRFFPTIHSHQQELLEISVVGVPADPNTLKAMLGLPTTASLTLATGPMVLEGTPAYPDTETSFMARLHEALKSSRR
jgi:hypothetical protein